MPWRRVRQQETLRTLTPMPHQSRCGSCGFERFGNPLKIEGCARSRAPLDARAGPHQLSGNGGDDGLV
jgi:hypothetical protein